MRTQNLRGLQVHRQAMEPARPSSLKPMFVGALIALTIILFGIAIPSPYVISKPGPVVNTLGEITVNGVAQPVIRFDGEPVSVQGELNLLTVSRVGSPDDRLGWLELLPSLFNPSHELVPIEQVFRPGETSTEREQANQTMMENSQMTATAAALAVLGETYDVEVRVENIVDGSPAEGVLRVGDRIVEMNEESVTGMGMVRRHVLESDTGASVDLVVEREGVLVPLEVTPEWNEATRSHMVGIVMSAEYAFDRDIEFDVDRIGGSSAGMVFSLAIIAELGESDLLGDSVVSGTGTVDDAGAVGAIGGLPQKLWAASSAGTDLFLMPVSNCADLPERRPADMEIVPVSTLAEAVQAIQNYNSGIENLGVQRCATELAQVAPVG